MNTKNNNIVPKLPSKRKRRTDKITSPVAVSEHVDYFFGINSKSSITRGHSNEYCRSLRTRRGTWVPSVSDKNTRDAALYVRVARVSLVREQNTSPLTSNLYVDECGSQKRTVRDVRSGVRTSTKVKSTRTNTTSRRPVNMIYPRYNVHFMWGGPHFTAGVSVISSPPRRKRLLHSYFRTRCTCTHGV